MEAVWISKTKRPLSSVVLADGLSESIVDDLREWKASSTWYHDRGIPYRRGYLLHGPPGSGKTSFILALAGHLDYSICVMSLSESHLTDDRLAEAMSVVPQRSIVLLEDIDAAFSNSSTVSFSGLLNVLDGVASSEERIIFMTTNHYERLDPALVRPGRVDVVHEIGDATASQCARLFSSYYDHLGDDAELASFAEQFASNVSKLPAAPSMAELQGYLMKHKDDVEEQHAVLRRVC